MKKDFPDSMSAKPSFAKAHHASVRDMLAFYGIGLLFVAVAGATWALAKELLLFFACVLFAILLNGASRKFERWLHLSHYWALALVLALSALVFGLGGWLMAPQIVEQSNELFKTVPQTFDRLLEQLEQYGMVRNLIGQLPPADELAAQASDYIARAGIVFSGALGVIGNIAIILFVGIYLAAQPGVYIRGVVTLVPKPGRPRAYKVMHELGETLSQWLLGKLISMVVVGVATAIGMNLLDVPLALVLGIIAGLLDFIPYIGPIMAAVPAILLGLSHGPEQGMYIALFFIGLQLAEGYLLQPLVERKTVSLPPALTIAAQVLLGALFGLAGVALATPLVAVITVLVIMLYVQDALKDPVKTPSEH
ncbi:MAG: family transporter [Noviherbaspirillum sp.]|nr:family transporter [Noviherbaspirillum sp.]